ncbi:MAG: hypothetical protein L0H93_17310, partial [Nocardioides sp.]|nr:hypothetical protein [Nocardioides sp.]
AGESPCPRSGRGRRVVVSKEGPGSGNKSRTGVVQLHMDRELPGSLLTKRRHIDLRRNSSAR